MRSTRNVQALPSASREFDLRVLKHARRDGTPVYTVGIWENGVLRSICHAKPIALALVALGREFETADPTGSKTISYPRWSEIADLVSRLDHRADTDCIAAASHIADLHSRLHNTMAELEATLERLAKLGTLIEHAAANAMLVGECQESKSVTFPQDVWFRLLAMYRDRQEGRQAYTELQSLREIAGITAETLRTVDDWLGHASTREGAMEALWRLRRILERAGFKMPLEHLEWRGQIIRALEEAGLGLGEDGAIRVRQPNDKYWEPATGRLVAEILHAGQHQST
jgi:hypothetical protein